MPHTDKLLQTFETSEDGFIRTYAFDMEDGLRKSIMLARSGRSFMVEITYADGAVVDTTTETFETDGSVRISVTEGGVYLTSYCALLADRVRLRRTRFF